MLNFRHGPLAAALAAFLVGCGGGGDNRAVEAAPTETAATDSQFTLAASSEHALVNPIVAATPGMGSPDPSVVFRDGYYHYCRTLPGGAIGIAKARRLQDIGSAPMVTIWTPPPGTAYSQQVWAPELQYLRGRWYVYFAASDGVIANHRMYALEGPSGDAQGAYAFKGRLAARTDRYAIDGIALESAGRLYFVWSGWRREGDSFPQVLYIAPMSDPLTLSGERHEIAAPDHAWESVEAPLVEGPAVLVRDGRIHIAYSASASWSDDYKLGLLSFSGGNILDAAAWKKLDTPVFVKRPAAGVYGPGHNSFVKSPDGQQDWIVYHAIDYSGGGWLHRSVRAQPFTWSADGLPRFGRTAALSAAPQAPPQR